LVDLSTIEEEGFSATAKVTVVVSLLVVTKRFTLLYYFEGSGADGRFLGRSHEDGCNADTSQW
jgi:hypothetical protein